MKEICRRERNSGQEVPITDLYSCRFVPLRGAASPRQKNGEQSGTEINFSRIITPITAMFHNGERSIMYDNNG